MLLSKSKSKSKSTLRTKKKNKEKCSTQNGETEALHNTCIETERNENTKLNW